MFVDASALVAILKREPEAQGFVAALEAARGGILVSPLVRFEAAMSLAMQMNRASGAAQVSERHHEVAAALVDELLAEIGAEEIALTPEIGRAALAAALAWGKLAGHPARLNMGDCFSYACAKTRGVPLLYKGADFALTDLA